MDSSSFLKIIEKTSHLNWLFLVMKELFKLDDSSFNLINCQQFSSYINKYYMSIGIVDLSMMRIPDYEFNGNKIEFKAGSFQSNLEQLLLEMPLNAGKMLLQSNSRAVRNHGKCHMNLYDCFGLTPDSSMSSIPTLNELLADILPKIKSLGLKLNTKVPDLEVNLSMLHFKHSYAGKDFNFNDLIALADDPVFGNMKVSGDVDLPFFYRYTKSDHGLLFFYLLCYPDLWNKDLDEFTCSVDRISRNRMTNSNHKVRTYTRLMEFWREFAFRPHFADAFLAFLEDRGLDLEKAAELTVYNAALFNSRDETGISVQSYPDKKSTAEISGSIRVIPWDTYCSEKLLEIAHQMNIVDKPDIVDYLMESDSEEIIFIERNTVGEEFLISDDVSAFLENPVKALTIDGDCLEQPEIERSLEQVRDSPQQTGNLIHQVPIEKQSAALSNQEAAVSNQEAAVSDQDNAVQIPSSESFLQHEADRTISSDNDEQMILNEGIELDRDADSKIEAATSDYVCHENEAFEEISQIPAEDNQTDELKPPPDDVKSIASESNSSGNDFSALTNMKDAMYKEVWTSDEEEQCGFAESLQLASNLLEMEDFFNLISEQTLLTKGSETAEECNVPAMIDVSQPLLAHTTDPDAHPSDISAEKSNVSAVIDVSQPLLADSTNLNAKPLDVPAEKGILSEKDVEKIQTEAPNNTLTKKNEDCQKLSNIASAENCDNQKFPAKKPEADMKEAEIIPMTEEEAMKTFHLSEDPAERKASFDAYGADFSTSEDSYDDEGSDWSSGRLRREVNIARFNRDTDEDLFALEAKNRQIQEDLQQNIAKESKENVDESVDNSARCSENPVVVIRDEEPLPFFEKRGNETSDSIPKAASKSPPVDSVLQRISKSGSQMAKKFNEKNPFAWNRQKSALEKPVSTDNLQKLDDNAREVQFKAYRISQIEGIAQSGPSGFKALLKKNSSDKDTILKQLSSSDSSSKRRSRQNRFNRSSSEENLSPSNVNLKAAAVRKFTRNKLFLKQFPAISNEMLELIKTRIEVNPPFKEFANMCYAKALHEILFPMGITCIDLFTDGQQHDLLEYWLELVQRLKLYEMISLIITEYDCTSCSSKTITWDTLAAISSKIFSDPTGSTEMTCRNCLKFCYATYKHHFKLSEVSLWFNSDLYLQLSKNDGKYITAKSNVEAKGISLGGIRYEGNGSEGHYDNKTPHNYCKIMLNNAEIPRNFYKTHMETGKSLIDSAKQLGILEDYTRLYDISNAPKRNLSEHYSSEEEMIPDITDGMADAEAIQKGIEFFKELEKKEGYKPKDSVKSFRTFKSHSRSNKYRETHGSSVKSYKTRRSSMYDQESEMGAEDDETPAFDMSQFFRST